MEAAGHRPCFECRREDSYRFKKAWLEGNPLYGFTEKTSIVKIDSIIQEERVTSSREKMTFPEELDKLPNGTFISHPERPEDAFLTWEGELKAWTPSGYVVGPQYSSDLMVTVLTPASTVNALHAGYVPQIIL